MADLFCDFSKKLSRVARTVPSNYSEKKGKFTMILETRNSKLDTRNSKLETRNSKLETRNSKLDTRYSKLETRHPGIQKSWTAIFSLYYMVTICMYICGEKKSRGFNNFEFDFENSRQQAGHLSLNRDSLLTIAQQWMLAIQLHHKH